MPTTLPASCPIGRTVRTSRVPTTTSDRRPILVALPSGKRALVVGQKSAVVHALDPDDKGRVLWMQRSAAAVRCGGVERGSAAEGETHSRSVLRHRGETRWTGRRQRAGSRSGSGRRDVRAAALGRHPGLAHAAARLRRPAAHAARRNRRRRLSSAASCFRARSMVTCAATRPRTVGSCGTSTPRSRFPPSTA